jgi:hypothetical protein
MIFQGNFSYIFAKTQLFCKKDLNNCQGKSLNVFNVPNSAKTKIFENSVPIFACFHVLVKNFVFFSPNLIILLRYSKKFTFLQICSGSACFNYVIHYHANTQLQAWSSLLFLQYCTGKYIFYKFSIEALYISGKWPTGDRIVKKGQFSMDPSLMKRQ